MISGQKVGNLRLISGEDRFFFRDHYDFGTKAGNLRLIPGEDLFFRDCYDFGAISAVFCLFSPLIFLMSQNDSRLKKVAHPLGYRNGILLPSELFKLSAKKYQTK